MWKNPDIDPSAFIAPSADIYGDVSIAENCSIWFHATVRAGAGSVSIGAGTVSYTHLTLPTKHGV